MRGSRRGFSMIEILVALTILAITLGGLAGVTFRYIRSGETTSAILARAGALNMETQRLSVLPFDSLASRVGCANVTGGALPYRRCVTVTNVNGTHRRVTIMVTPANTAIRPDSTVIERTRPLTGNPLKP